MNEEKELTTSEKTANSIYDRLGLKDGLIKNKIKGHLKTVMIEEIDAYRAKVRESIYGFGSNIGINAVIEFVCERYLITEEELHGKTRKRNFVEARQVCHWMVKKNVCFNKLSLDAIGYMIGGRDHATVIHSVKTISNLIETDKVFRERIMAMCNDLGARTAWMESDGELLVTGYMKAKQNED